MNFTGILCVIIQYLLSPIPFLLTFILPIIVCVINHRYLWFSILLTLFIEIAINWKNFIYYESRGLMLFFTLAQIAVMAIIILSLKSIASKRNR